MDYGYQSDDAFRVAFKKPVRHYSCGGQEIQPQPGFYCRLTFEINIMGDRKK